MPHELENTIALLSYTPAALNALLRHLPDVWTMQDEGKDTWTICEVVAHLAYAERVNWLPRVRLLLEFGEGRAFGPFDRLGYQAEAQGKSLAEILDEFARLRSQNIADLRAMHLGPEQLAKRGKHPSFGAVTLSELLATWAAHDLTHLHQITRIMAYQYRDFVGPFRAFLGVLKCAGHSSSA